MEIMGSRGSLIVAAHVGPMFRETNDKAHKAAVGESKKAARGKRVWHVALYTYRNVPKPHQKNLWLRKRPTHHPFRRG